MKARVVNSSRYIQTEKSNYYNNKVYTAYYNPTIKQDIIVYGDDIGFDIRMTSTNGFCLPCDSDIEVEIKFTVIPKPQSPTIKTFK